MLQTNSYRLTPKRTNRHASRSQANCRCVTRWVETGFVESKFYVARLGLHSPLAILHLQRQTRSIDLDLWFLCVFSLSFFSFVTITHFYLTQEEVEVMIKEDLNLFAELSLHHLLAGIGEVRGTLADAAKGQGVAAVGSLFGQTGSGRVDGRPAVLGAHRVAAVLELVVAGVEGEGLHDVGAGP